MQSSDTPLSDSAHTSSLAQHFLVAMPSLEDDLFERSLIYLCQHDEKGAVGLCVNQPMPLLLVDLFKQMELPLHRDDLQEHCLCWGGPVQSDRGFMLHPQQPIEEQTPWPYASSLHTSDGLQMTTSKDIVHMISAGGGPSPLFATLGYAAWEHHQLEEELATHTWLAVPADNAHHIIFSMPHAQRYDAALQLLGIDAAQLTHGGHA